ncbi:MAG TPA: bifunctional 3-(3-hydroxy-phenyl)propionate/3-hydroxycinnamic acid hydroxylase [Polyangiales bacterium]
MSSILPREVDVLVSGYGPVGAALACLLGRYGVRTLVIDKAADIFLAPRAVALDNEALRILQLAGLADDAFAKVAIPYVRMLCPHVGEFLKIDTSGTIDGHPKLVTFHQPGLERALRAQVATHDTVTTATSVELESFVDSDVDGVVRATLKSADGAEHIVHARFLVGADGASSTVRAAIGQDFVGKTYSEDWLIVDALGVPGHFDHVEFLCNPERPTPHMVAPGGRTRWEFMLHPGEAPEDMETDETILRLLAPWADARQLTIERRAVYRFHARSCDRYSRGRVFLVGDAAHITPPFVGQGLVAGLRDAANLAWKLAWVTHHHAHRSILDSYDEERRPHAVKMIALAKLMGQLIMPRTAAAAALIHGALKIARRVPGVGPYVEGLEVKPKQRFDSGLFVKGRSQMRHGSVIPQFRVRTPQGRIVSSDDALGPSIALVGFGADAAAHLRTATRQRWAELGGTTVSLVAADHHEQRAGGACVVLDDPFAPRLMRRGWCAVVRPDRTILHDGPAVDAERIASEAIALIEGAA